jgi:hypothetical protein
MAQSQRRGNLSKAERLARAGQMRQHIGFGNWRAGFIGAWHGRCHCKRFASKRRSREKYRFTME